MNLALKDVNKQNNEFETDLELKAYFSVDAKFLSATKALATCLGYTLEELQEKKLHEIFSEELNKALDFDEFWKKSSTSYCEVSNLTLTRKSGRPANLRGMFYKQHDLSKGNVSCTLVDISDISEELKVRSEIMDVTSIVSESDLKGNILSINPKFIELSQYSMDELIGQPHNTTRHPDMPKEVFKELWATIGRGKIFRGVVKNRKKDGTPYYVDAVIAPLMGDNGKPRKYLGVRYDITELEIERQNAKGLLRALDSNFIFLEMDLKGKIHAANSVFLDHMSYRKEDIEGKNLSHFSKGFEAIEDQILSNISQGKSWSGQYPLETKEGKAIWLNSVFAPVCDETGRVLKISCVANNITGEKLKSLAASEAQAVIEFNLEGVILNANDNFLKTTGYSLNEVQGKQHKIFCEDAFINTDGYRNHWTRLGRGETITDRFKRVHKNGNTIWIQATYSPNFDIYGRACGVTKFCQDITIQVEVEETVTKLATEFSQKTHEISERSSGVARGAQALGATTEEMNASIEELTASINSIAQNSKNTDGVAKATHKEAEDGSKAIKDAITAMELISRSSEDINEIVKVISEIAGQTNLLAFNAAIEAARAGEHGLGFSVVADEVRKLAERSSQATKEISKLINESVKRIAQGSEISKQAGIAFDKIVVGVNKTTQSISEVSCAAEEQLVAAKEISSAIQQVAEETERAASASDSIAEATKDLNKASDVLRLTVERFKK